ncbi:MAG: FAD-dependent oxidoreductase, partial [Clostridia bacterium]
IFENTEATNILKRDDGYVVVTKYGIMIKCSKIVCSSGYNTSFLTDEKLCDKFISYTIVTNPLKNFSWKDGVLLQDNENPYHYIRSTFDNRIVVGGEDILFKNNVISEKVAEKKYDKLFKFLKTLFIKLPKNIKIDYKFCGAFSSTKNNLAVMGESKTNPDIWLLLGYGANGIIYSIYGAQKLVQKYHGLKDEFFEKHFSPKRVLP